MINLKKLKVNDTVWFSQICFASKTPSRCYKNMPPTECIVWKIDTKVAEADLKVIYFIQSKFIGMDNPPIMYRINEWEYKNGLGAEFIYPSYDEAVEAYNREINVKLDFLQSQIDILRKKIIK